MSQFTGYAIEHEERNWLMEASVEVQAYAAGYQDAKPRNVKSWLRTEDQGQVGRCAGMAEADAGEVNFWIATGNIIQFNGHYSYIKGQKRVPQLYGRDNGTTISSVLKSAMEDGLCPTGEGDAPDKNWRYGLPPNYTTQLPAGADEQASVFKIRSHTWIDSTDKLHAYVKSNIGAVIVGARWGNWQPDSQGVVRRFASGGGAHAWSIVDWLDNGLMVGHNSHRASYGDDGFMYLTPEFLNGFFRDPSTSVVGISDLSVPVPRRVNWLEADVG